MTWACFEKDARSPWRRGVAAGLLFLAACADDARQQADGRAGDCRRDLTFEAATFYTGATDHYFTDSRGRRVSFRVESGEVARRGFADLVVRGEEGPPDTNPAMVGRSFTVCRSAGEYELREGS